ncbi:hypothetical protein JW960_18480 [candidate division KSB1 bacterium]|nr:hypothetical protein [candidate division KSB1 bacterium]
MNKLLIAIVTFTLVGSCFGQTEYWPSQQQTRTFRTSIVIQNWGIDGIDERIAEGTFPLNLYWPVNNKLNLQLTHSPAMSRFGDLQLSGMSDTWINGSYALSDDKYIISMGMGLPTGKSKLTTEEYELQSSLSNNMFHFRLPVYGQGFTLNMGFASVYSINEKTVLGGGANFVFKAPYQISESLDKSYDPGNQLGLNAGIDHQFSDQLKLTVDLLYTYYTNDTFDGAEVFHAGGKTGAKLGFTYTTNKYIAWAVARYRSSGKNETWDGQTRALITEPLNTNITERELNAIFCYILSELFSIDVLFEARSYVENEYGVGQADVFGGGVGNHIQLRPNISLKSSFKIFTGDGYITNMGVPGISGIEFTIGTSVKF